MLRTAQYSAERGGDCDPARRHAFTMRLRNVPPSLRPLDSQSPCPPIVSVPPLRTCMEPPSSTQTSATSSVAAELSGLTAGLTGGTEGGVPGGVSGGANGGGDVGDGSVQW